MAELISEIYTNANLVLDETGQEADG